MATFTALDLTLAAVAVVRILGIDPGTKVVGFGCLEFGRTGDGEPGDRVAERVPLAMRGSNVVRVDSASAGAVRLLDAGALQLGSRSTPLTDRLLELQRRFAALVQELRPDEVAIEEAFYGKSVQAALRIGEARGVVLAESARAGLTVHQFAPARVKRCVTGHGAARKQQVANVLRHLVGAGRELLVEALPLDASDAVAVALTRLEERRSPLRAASLGVAAAVPRGSGPARSARRRSD